RAKLRKGINPSAERRQGRITQAIASGNTFRAVAAGWVDANRNQWIASHVARVQSSLERDILPLRGDRPISEIGPAGALEVIRRVDTREALDQSSRVLQRITSIFALGVATLRCPSNPARELRGSLKKAPKVQHRPSLAMKDFPDFRKRLEALAADPETKIA